MSLRLKAVKIRDSNEVAELEWTAEAVQIKDSKR
jgi:hypothetical protein